MGDKEIAETPEDAEQATMNRLRRMFAADGVGGYGPAEGPGVRCPFCPSDANASYVHITGRVNYLGNDNGDASERYGLGVRGDVTALEFWSETCAHRWALVFGFHKGGTFVRVVRLVDASGEIEEWTPM